jgi:putative ABC transport system ATP-binding protein
MPPLVELRALTRTYEEGTVHRTVLDALDASFAEGEFVALLGRSGSGKSTLLNLIGGIDQPTSGSCRVRGIELERLGERERTLFRRTHVGLVFQFFHLIPTLTVAENVLLPLDLAGRADAAGRRRVTEILELVGLADRAASFPDILSGGEQQRVALARAVVHDPALILADEPTGNLDETSATGVLDLLLQLCREGRHTVLMATHSHEASARADRVLLLEHGRLVEQTHPSRP